MLQSIGLPNDTSLQEPAEAILDESKVLIENMIFVLVRILLKFYYIFAHRSYEPGHWHLWRGPWNHLVCTYSDMQYKIQLMQKERELNDFAAKFKRGELKFNRDIKELKMAEEKAKQQLKEERNKHDKTTNAFKEAQEQNLTLQKRMAELKEEKDKEI